MAVQEDEINDLASEIEKSIRAAQRMKLDLIVYILTMARLEIENLSVQE